MSLPKLLTQILKKHLHEIDSFEIIKSSPSFEDLKLPQELNYSPFIFIPDEHLLAINKRNLIELFVESRSQFWECADKPIDTCKNILNSATIGLLVSSTEFTTIINARASFILQNELEELLWDLQFINIVVHSRNNKFNKSPLLFEYKKRITSKILEIYMESSYSSSINFNTSKFDIFNFFIIEVENTLKSASKHIHNYYCWTYLRYLVSTILSFYSWLDYDKEKFPLKEIKLHWNKIKKPIENWCFPINEKIKRDISAQSFFLDFILFKPSKNIINSFSKLSFTDKNNNKKNIIISDLLNELYYSQQEVYDYLLNLWEKYNQLIDIGVDINKSESALFLFKIAIVKLYVNDYKKVLELLNLIASSFNISVNWYNNNIVINTENNCSIDKQDIGYKSVLWIIKRINHANSGLGLK